MLLVEKLDCYRSEQLIFSNLDFRLAQGEILHVVGANGCGKSSLLKILCGLLPISSGEIHWQGMNIYQADTDYFQQLAYLGHKIGVKTGLTVRENLKIYAHLSSSRDIKEPEYDVILQQLELSLLKHKLCQQLSAGQLQRVALSRLLLSSAKLWILDEPFTAIDKNAIANLQQLMINHLQQGGMIIFTNHNMLDWGNLPVRYLNLS